MRISRYEIIPTHVPWDERVREMAILNCTEPILGRGDLADFQRQLSLLSNAGLEHESQRCWQDVPYDGKRVPPAASIQQLVACWRTLRKMHNGR
jgi:hypothetical protein